MAGTRYRSAITGLFIATWLAAAPSSADAQDSAQLTILVEDATGARIADAAVTLRRGREQREGRTSQDGRAAFRDLAVGEWLVTAVGTGFTAHEQVLSVPAVPTTITVRLGVAGLEEAVTVRGVRSPDTLQLDAPAVSGSHLDIPIRDLPATLTVVTRETIVERGAFSGEAAVEAAGGVESSVGVGSLPGFRTRGFSGNSVSIMRDGIRQNTQSQSSRPIDAFMLDRVEVLKGPASLLFGEGAVGAAINYVSRQPGRDLQIDGLLSYGSFGTYRVGIGVNVPLRPDLSARVDVSQSDTDGYVKPSGQMLRAVNASVLWTPTPRVSLKPSVTFTEDDVSSYYSTPLVNGEVDPRMRYINYNMQDNFSRGNNNFYRLDTDVLLPHGWRLRNGLFAATQRLDWANMEGYAYDAAADKVRVSSYFLIWRNDLLLGNQTDVRKTFNAGRYPINFIAGVNVQRNDQERGVTPTPPGTGGVVFLVDRYDPQPTFDPGYAWQRQRDVLVNTQTAFAEAQTGLTDRLKLVTGLRWEHIRVDYWPDQGLPVQIKHYHPVTGRIGAVHAITPDVNLYASYSQATEPTTQLVSLSADQQIFNLTPSWQFEGGAKATTLRGRLDATVAYYYIQKRDIPTRTEVDGVIVQDQIGKQRSLGVETNVSLRLRRGFSVDGDVAVTRAKFQEFNQNVGAGFISLAGNVPSGVPVVIWSVTPSQRVGPFSIATTVRQVGERWGDNNNTLKRPGYTTADLWASVRVPAVQNEARLTFRVRNLTDELYARGGGSNTSARLDPPRAFEVSLAVGVR